MEGGIRKSPTFVISQISSKIFGKMILKPFQVICDVIAGAWGKKF